MGSLCKLLLISHLSHPLKLKTIITDARFVGEISFGLGLMVGGFAVGVILSPRARDCFSPAYIKRDYRTW